MCFVSLGLMLMSARVNLGVGPLVDDSTVRGEQCDVKGRQQIQFDVKKERFAASFILFLLAKASVLAPRGTVG
jgi:hypothetical protein